MRVLACDWATKKALKIFDSYTSKVKTIQNTIPEFEKFLKSLKTEKVTFLLEFGGADTFKIMAFRAGHQVLQVPGKKIKDYRDSLGLEKTDEIDAKLIYDFYIEGVHHFHGIINQVWDSTPLDNQTPNLFSKPIDNEADAKMGLAAKPDITMPRLKKNPGGGAGSGMTNGSDHQLPSPFYPFTEGYADIDELKILFREHEDTKKEMVREKLRKIVFKKKFEIAQVSDNRTNKMLMHKDGSIIAKENELKELKKILEDKVKSFRVWGKYLIDVKGVGPVIAAGLIGELADADLQLAKIPGWERCLKETLTPIRAASQICAFEDIWTWS